MNLFTGAGPTTAADVEQLVVDCLRNVRYCPGLAGLSEKKNRVRFWST
jgi:hypothetical protein